MAPPLTPVVLCQFGRKIIFEPSLLSTNLRFSAALRAVFGPL